MKRVIFAGAFLALVASSGAWASDQDDVLATVHTFIDTINKAIVTASKKAPPFAFAPASMSCFTATGSANRSVVLNIFAIKLKKIRRCEPKSSAALRASQI